jgi:hypothetical protein
MIVDPSLVALNVFDDLESTADSLFGAGAGGWVLGGIMVFAILLPLALVFYVRGGGTSGMMFVAIAAIFAIAFNVGVGWWEPWSAVFILGMLAFVWWLVRGPASNQGGL